MDQARADGLTPLRLAAQKNHAAVAEALVTKGAAVDHAFDDGWTPLHLAAHCGNHLMLTLLADYGAEVDQALDDGTKPLHLAAQVGHINALLSHGAAPSKIRGPTVRPRFHFS